MEHANGILTWMPSALVMVCFHQLRFIGCWVRTLFTIPNAADGSRSSTLLNARPYRDSTLPAIALACSALQLRLSRADSLRWQPSATLGELPKPNIRHNAQLRAIISIVCRDSGVRSLE